MPTELLLGLPAVLEAAKQGSATRAATELNTTTATILRRIDVIEALLGTRLFERTPSGLVATVALQTVLPWAEQCAASIDGMLRDVSGLDPTPSGIVRVTAPPTLASHLLVPMIGELRNRCPDLTVEFASGTALANLGQREADLALRAIKPTDGDLVFRKLSDYRMVIAVAPTWVEQARNDPANLPWLTWSSTMSHIPEARWLAGTFPDARVALRASDLTTLVRAARTGAGALLVAEPIAAVEGGLVSVPLESVQLPAGSIYLIAHRALRNVPRVAAVWQWIESYFETPKPELEMRDAW